MIIKRFLAQKQVVSVKSQANKTHFIHIYTYMYVHMYVLYVLLESVTRTTINKLYMRICVRKYPVLEISSFVYTCCCCYCYLPDKLRTKEMATFAICPIFNNLIFVNKLTKLRECVCVYVWL